MPVNTTRAGRLRRNRAFDALAICIVLGVFGCRPDAETGSMPGSGEPSTSDDAFRNRTRAAAGDQREREREQQEPRALDRQVARLTPDASTDEVDAEAVGAIVTCVVCHGVNGEGNAALEAPRIGGMAAWYLARQLKHFRTGVRAATDSDKHGTQMRAIAVSLEDDEVIADLATYLSGLHPPYAEETTVRGDVAHGEELYTVCAACHGMDAGGSEQLSTPSLVGQYDWYLVRQLQNYRNRLRGVHPEDVYGMQMMPIVQATLMSDQDVADVVAFIKTLPRTAEQPPAPDAPRTLGQATDTVQSDAEQQAAAPRTDERSRRR